MRQKKEKQGTASVRSRGSIGVKVFWVKDTEVRRRELISYTAEAH